MSSKIVKKWALFIASAAGVAFLLIVILIPANVRLFNSVEGVAVKGKVPTRLTIPTINIDAAIEPVGLTPDGAMAVPKGPSDVAWFTLGPRPGEIGSAVISGHFGWKDNMPAVFDDLYTLHKGDKVIVKNDRGETVTFVVRELRTFNENADASSVFGSTDGKAHLNLITCEGIWNKDSKSYSERLVVFTDAI
jgi:LPXTG-site transpeptidase (sortase) family protein